MGLKNFFSKEGKEARAIAKWEKKLMGKYQQTSERKRAVEELTRIGTTDAIATLLKRYQYRTEQTITDEDEKEMVYNCCVELGRSAVPGLIQYINTETGIYWPVKALREIVGDDEAVNHLLQALENVEDVFGTNRQRKEELVDQMRNFADNDRVFDRLLVLCQDDDEEIVIRAVDGLSVRGDDPEVVEAIIPMLLKDESSHRLRTMIMELMLEQEWNIRRWKKDLKEKIPDSYWIDDTGVVRRK